VVQISRGVLTAQLRNTVRRKVRTKATANLEVRQPRVAGIVETAMAPARLVDA
jgi:hypothetical protein